MMELRKKHALKVDTSSSICSEKPKQTEAGKNMLSQRTQDTPAPEATQIGRANRSKRRHGGSLRLIKLPLLPLIVEGKCLKQRMSSKVEFYKTLVAIRKRPEPESILGHGQTVAAGVLNNFTSASSPASVSDIQERSFLFDFRSYVL